MEIRDEKCVALPQGNEKSAGWYSSHMVLAIGFCRTAALTGYPWPNG